MAVSRYKTFSRRVCNLNFSNLLKCFQKNQIPQHYSQYAPHFKQPIFDKSEIEKRLKEISEEELQSTDFRAAESFKTCSVFYDEDVSLFIRYVMRKGLKEVARKQVEKAFAHIKHIQIRKYNKELDENVKGQILLNPREVFHTAVKNATPQMGVMKLKKSGTWYQIPTGIMDKRAKFLAMNWIIKESKQKDKNKRFYEALGEELVLSSQGEGKAVKKKLELHKLCETNRSYAHYKWT